MKSFLRGVGVGAIAAYIFHDDLDKGLKKGLAKVNEIVDGPPKTTQPTSPSPTTATGREV